MKYFIIDPILSLLVWAFKTVPGALWCFTFHSFRWKEATGEFRENWGIQCPTCGRGWDQVCHYY